LREPLESADMFRPGYTTYEFGCKKKKKKNSLISCDHFAFCFLRSTR
jgi:hypothetical protein